MHRFCPVCHTRYDEGETFCARDGAELQEPGHGHAGNLIGTTVADRYEVVAQIATGGMGVVYKARQKMLDRSVALKVLPKELSNDPDTERRFFNEARAISQLRHPHIVTLFDFGRTVDRKLFIAMEYVNGEPLAVHIENRPLPVDTAIRIADQILDALSEAHRAGIVHRDIKPDNVMLEVRGGRLFVRLLDFGIAKSDFDTARLTKTGIVFGTPEYISPEQVLGKPSDHRADLYAVGLVLFEMLSGHRPYGGSGTAIAYKHGHDPVPSLLKKFPGLDVPPTLDALIYRLMAKDPADRPGTADDVRRLLLDASLGADLSYPSGPLPSLDLEPLGPPLGLDALDAMGPLGEIGDGPDPFGHPAGLDVPRSRALTVSSGPPRAGAPLSDPPGHGKHPSIDRALGARPPRLSVDAPATVQVPREMLQQRPSSRRVLLLSGMLAVIGVGSLAASMWIDRPFPLQPLPPRPVPATMPAAPAPEEAPTWSQEVLDGLTGTLRPRPTPPRLKSADDLAVLPLPAGAVNAAERPDARRQRISDARAALAALDETDGARVALLRRIGDLEWTEANAAYEQALAHYEQASGDFVKGARDAAPAPPVPAYGDAIVAYEQLLDAAPADDWLLAALGHGLMSAGRRADGLGHLRALLERFPDSPYAQRARLAVAEHAFAADRPAEALPHFEALTAASDPLLARYAQFQLGYVYGALDRFDDAVDAFQRLLEAVRQASEAARHFRPQAFDGLTLAYTHLPGGRRQATSYFRGLGGAKLARRQARLLAMAYAAKGDPAEAAAAWRMALDDVKTPIEGPGERATTLVRLAEQEAAAGQVDEALALIDGPLLGCAPLGEGAEAVDCRLTQANALLVGARVDEAVAAFEPIAALPADGPLAEAVAEARFRMAEVRFRAFMDHPPAGPALADAVGAVDGAYARVVEPAVDRWLVAADCRRGQLHARHAELMDGADAAAIEAARTRAMDHFAAAERRATEAEVETRWARAASAQLAAMRGGVESAAPP